MCVRCVCKLGIVFFMYVAVYIYMLDVCTCI